ncbi:MAG: type IV pilin protein [Candidatus Omnitrophota bacterium]|jgi:type IV pilus assembly protein PilE
MKKGFTLMEILIVFIIVAVLAAIALPGYSKTVQKNEKRRAETYLRAIRLAQKMYYAKNATYACTSSCADASSIKTALGVEIADGNYVFSMAATTTTFTATATGYTKTLSLDQDGTWSGTDTPLPTV